MTDVNENRPVSDPFEKPSIPVVRFTMCHDLQNLKPEESLPFGYRTEPWVDPLLPAYASAMAVSYSDSPELEVFPQLGSREGCLQLVQDIRDSRRFISGASWLIFYHREPCAFLISAVGDTEKIAGIRIVGVAPRHRSIGLGNNLVIKALWAYHDNKYESAFINVSRDNRKGVLFLRSLGFYVDSSKEYL